MKQVVISISTIFLAVGLISGCDGKKETAPAATQTVESAAQATTEAANQTAQASNC